MCQPFYKQNKFWIKKKYWSYIITERYGIKSVEKKLSKWLSENKVIYVNWKINIEYFYFPNQVPRGDIYI
jgi:hypothetical protein